MKTKLKFKLKIKGHDSVNGDVFEINQTISISRYTLLKILPLLYSEGKTVGK